MCMNTLVVLYIDFLWGALRQGRLTAAEQNTKSLFARHSFQVEIDLYLDLKHHFLTHKKNWRAVRSASPWSIPLFYFYSWFSNRAQKNTDANFWWVSTFEGLKPEAVCSKDKIINGHKWSLFSHFSVFLCNFSIRWYLDTWFQFDCSFTIFEHRRGHFSLTFVESTSSLKKCVTLRYRSCDESKKTK